MTSTSSCQSNWNKWLKLLHSSSSSMDVNRGADLDRSKGGLKFAWPLTRCLLRTGIPPKLELPGKCEETLQDPSMIQLLLVPLLLEVMWVDEDPPFMVLVVVDDDPPTIVPFLVRLPPTPALPAIIKFNEWVCVSEQTKERVRKRSILLSQLA